MQPDERLPTTPIHERGSTHVSEKEQTDVVSDLHLIRFEQWMATARVCEVSRERDLQSCLKSVDVVATGSFVSNLLISALLE